MEEITVSTHYRLKAKDMSSQNIYKEIGVITRIETDNDGDGDLDSSAIKRRNELLEEHEERSKLSSQYIIDETQVGFSLDTLNVLLNDKSNLFKKAL